MTAHIFIFIYPYKTGTNENETGKGWVKGDKYFANYNDNTIISNGNNVEYC